MGERAYLFIVKLLLGPDAPPPVGRLVAVGLLIVVGRKGRCYF